MKPQAVIYVRVSSLDQVDNTSLENQEKECRKWCERNGYEATKVFRDEAQSAKTAKRPELMAALEHCRKHREHVDAFVIWKVDRFARNNLDFLQLRAFLAGLGITTKSATEAFEDDPAGNLMANILGAFAQFDNELRGERAKAGMKARANDGCWVWFAPLGYQNARTPDGKPTLKPHPVNGPLIQRGFELYGTGANAQTEVVETLQAIGLKGSYGGKITKQSFQQILSNPVYAGWLVSDLIGPEPVKGNWEPLVSQELFDRVQAMMNGKSNPAEVHARRRPEFPLRGFVLCGHCEGPLTASFARGRNGTRYPYYHCTRCKDMTTRKEILEEAFLDLLDGLKPEPEIFGLVKQEVLAVWKEKESFIAEEKGQTERRLKDLKNRKEKLLDLLLDGTVDADTYKKELEKIEGERLATNFEHSDELAEGFDIEALLNFTETMLGDARKMWLLCNLEQRQVFQGLMFPEKLKWDGDCFGTPVTHFFINWLQPENGGQSNLAPRVGLEPTT